MYIWKTSKKGREKEKKNPVEAWEKDINGQCTEKDT